MPTVNENPWVGINAEKAAAWDALTPADQKWLGNADPTDEIILLRAPNRGEPLALVNAVENTTAEGAGEDPYAPDVDPFGVENEERDPDAVSGPDTAGTNEQATLALARSQAQLSAQRIQSNSSDWRVKLKLAPNADYLYKDPGAGSGILAPLAASDGVVFPYTPQVATSYRANYDTTDLVHSNYRGYFYQNSFTDEITIDAVFTAQDTQEANYLLAVMHFFRSVTKMFYGQDANRGQPPPLVFLQGLGEYQYNLHPCVVSSCAFNLPNDVDYIRARSANINGTNLLQRRVRSATTPFFEFSLSGLRLAAANLLFGAIPKGSAPGASAPPPTLGLNSPTYVPTKMSMTIGLLPVQSRDQISKQFSLKQFANGDLVKAGFW